MDSQLGFIEDARWLLATLEVYNISHTCQEGNGCAEWVSKWIRERGTQFVMLGGFPLDLKRRVEANATGISYEKMYYDGLSDFS